MSQKYPIVVIEDDTDDQEIICEISRELMPGHTQRCYANGVEALKYLQTTPEQPFIILCDLNMPLMNGLELLEIIQQTPYLKNKSIPFVFLSTSGDKRYVQRAYELGVQGFFQKPPDLKELRSILKLSFEFWAKCLHPHHPQINSR